MHPKILFVFFIAAFVHAPTTSRAYLFKDCEYTQLKRCDEVFMSRYKVHDNQNVSQDVLMEMYCNRFQRYVNCLSSTAWCKGLFIDLDRLMILQHALMDKKLGVCPKHNVNALRRLVAVDLHLKSGHSTAIDVDNFAKCAQDIHLKCATKMAQDLKDDSRMCFGVRNFVLCYKNPGISCHAKIYKDFNSTLQSLAKLLLQLFKEKQGVMPNC